MRPSPLFVHYQTPSRPPTLAEAQRFLGGFVELVPTVHGQLLCNEDGIALGLPLNTPATRLMGTPIVGNVLLLEGTAQWT